MDDPYLLGQAHDSLKVAIWTHCSHARLRRMIDIPHEEMAMKIHIGAAFAMVAALGAASADAQPAAKNIEAHLAAAKAAAEFDFTGTLARTCIAPQTGPGRDVAPGPAPDRKTWFTEPAKVFDNLYFVGTKIHSSWALTGSEGIILIDTLYDYASEEAIVGGLKKLGLDPAKVKYVIISHAHGDHVGGAKLMQDRFGSRLVMGAPDWDADRKIRQSISARKAQARYRRGRRPEDHAWRYERDAHPHARSYAGNDFHDVPGEG